MIDIHCHVLPGIDDGCRNMQTTLEVLDESHSQGIDYIIATPHFYASRDRIDNFIYRRNNALSEICRTLGKTPDKIAPRLFMGGEVAYFHGISSAEGIEQLSVEGTNIILLEMPFDDWQQYHIDEITRLITERQMRIIIAHLERFMTRHNKPYIEQIIDMTHDMPVRIQINAEALLERHQRRQILKMFRNKEAHYLASDCHGMHRRPPNLAAGRQILRQKLGEAFLKEMDEAGEEFLREAGLHI